MQRVKLLFKNLNLLIKKDLESHKTITGENLIKILKKSLSSPNQVRRDSKIY